MLMMKMKMKKNVEGENRIKWRMAKKIVIMTMEEKRSRTRRKWTVRSRGWW